jgi:hypothetical protein
MFFALLSYLSRRRSLGKAGAIPAAGALNSWVIQRRRL